MVAMARLEVSVRPATAADVRPLAAVLGRAFEDDPPFVWMLPDARTRQSRAGRFFGTVVRTEALALGAVEVACLDGVIVGGAVWYPPGRWTPGVRLRTLLGFARAFGRRLGPAAALEQAMVRAHPRDPHWYLFAIGVDPAHQSSGVAGSLLRSRLTRRDQAGEPAYLESSKLANVPLYQHGWGGAAGHATRRTLSRPELRRAVWPTDERRTGVAQGAGQRAG
jgi:ribosomal protein S18 acetylase RimI-like enzyme